MQRAESSGHMLFQMHPDYRGSPVYQRCENQLCNPGRNPRKELLYPRTCFLRRGVIPRPPGQRVAYVPSSNPQTKQEPPGAGSWVHAGNPKSWGAQSSSLEVAFSFSRATFAAFSSAFFLLLP